MRRPFKGAFRLVLTLFVFVVLFLGIFLGLKFLEQRALSAVSRAVGRPVSYRLVWLHPLDGLVLEKVEAKGLFRAKRLSIRFDLVSLFKKREIYWVKAEGIYLNLDSLPKSRRKGQAKPAPSQGKGGLALRLETVVLRACTLVVGNQTFTGEKLAGSLVLAGGRLRGHAEGEELGGFGLFVEKALLDFRISPEGVEVFNLKSGGDLEVEGGRITFSSKEGLLELSARAARWQRMRLYRFHLAWWLKTGKLEASAASVRWDTLEVSRALARGSLRGGVLRVGRLTAFWEGNFLNASGELSGKGWRVRVETPDFSWAGVRFSGWAEAEGTGRGARARLALEGVSYKGFEADSLKAWVSTEDWKEFALDSLEIKGPLWVKARGQYRGPKDFALNFEAENRGLMGARGFARLKGEVSRRDGELFARLEGLALRFRWKNVGIGRLGLEAELLGTRRAQVALWAVDAGLGNFKLDSLQLEGVFGDTLGGAVVFARSREGWLSAELTARYSPDGLLRVDAQRLTLAMRGVEVLRARGAVLTKRGEAWSFSVPRGEAFFGSLSLGGTFVGDSVELAGVLDSVSLDALREALAVGDTLEGTGAVFFNLSGTLSEPKIPSVNLTFKDLRWGSLALDSAWLSLSYDGETLRLDSAKLSALGGEVRAEGLVPLKLSLVPFRFTLDPDAPLAARVAFSGSAKPVEGLFSQFLVLEKSKVEGEVLVYGTVARPLLTGSLKLEAPGGVLVSTNTYMRRIEGQVIFEGDKLSLEGVKAVADGGQAVVSGSVLLYPELETDIEIDISDFPIMPDPFLEARVSGHLNVLGSPTKPFVKGNITVDEAYFYAPIGYKPPPSAAAKPNLAKYRIRIKAPRGIYFSNELADIELAADILVEKEPAAPMTLSGELEALSGKIYFLDRVFDLKEARLHLSRQTELNPEIHAVGETKVEDYLIRITVDGNLRHPQVRLTSEPPLPEGEIISMLAMGASPGTAQATSRALNLAEGLLSRELRRRIRLRELEVRTGLSGESQLVLGMYLTKNLYFRYTGALSGAREESYELKYYIRSNLAIYTKKDPQGTGAGFEFRFRF